MCFTWCHIHFQANLCCSAREFFGGEACHLVKLQHTRLLRHCGEIRHDHVLGSCAPHIEQHARVPGRPLYRLYLELEVVHDHTLAALIVYPCSIESTQSLSLFALVFRRTLYGEVVRPRDSVCVTGAEVQDDPYCSAGPPRTSQMTDRASPPAHTVVEPTQTDATLVQISDKTNHGTESRSVPRVYFNRVLHVRVSSMVVLRGKQRKDCNLRVSNHVRSSLREQLSSTRHKLETAADRLFCA